MPSIRRTRRPRGSGGGTSASRYMLTQCSKCGATASAYTTERGASLNLPTVDGRHADCGGRIRAFDITAGRR